MSKHSTFSSNESTYATNSFGLTVPTSNGVDDSSLVVTTYNLYVIDIFIDNILSDNHALSLSFALFSIAGYSIQWNHRNIPVFRPDVECTNGIIHVIDHPFLVDSDIRVTAGSSQPFNGIQTTANLLVAIVVMLIAANHLV